MPLSAVSQALQNMVNARDWSQFHTPENLAKSVCIEAGELLQCFQWNEAASTDQVAGELADVLTYCYLLADRLQLDVDQIVLTKLEETERKYPAEKVRGRSTRYDQLPD